MSGQAWSYLSPRALMPQGDRLSNLTTAKRMKPAPHFERALDLYFKGRTATGRSSGEGGGAQITPEDVKHALGGLKERPYRFGMAAFLDDAQSLRLIEGYLVEELRWLADAGEWIQTRDDLQRLEAIAGLMLFEVMAARSRHETFAHEDRLPAGSATVRCPKCNGQGKYVDTRALKKWRRYRRIVLRARLEEPGVPDADGRPVKPSWHVHEALLERARLAEAKAMAVDCDLCFKTGRYVFSESSRARAAGIPRRTWTRTWCDRYAEGLEIPRRWEAIAVGHVRRRLKLDP